MLTTQKEISTATSGLHLATVSAMGVRVDAVDDRRVAILGRVRVHLVDPAAYTPPYDRALAAALARAGAEVELWTSASATATCRAARRRDACVEPSTAGRRARGRRYARLAQHVPDMLRYRRAARARRRRALPVAAGPGARRPPAAAHVHPRC